MFRASSGGGDGGGQEKESSLVSNLLKVAKDLEKIDYIKKFKSEYEKEMSGKVIKNNDDDKMETETSSKTSEVNQEPEVCLRMEVYEDKRYDIEEVKFWNFISKNNGVKPNVIRTVVYKCPETSYTIKKCPVVLPKKEKIISTETCIENISESSKSNKFDNERLEKLLKQSDQCFKETKKLSPTFLLKQNKKKLNPIGTNKNEPDKIRKVGRPKGSSNVLKQQEQHKIQTKKEKQLEQHQTSTVSKKIDSNISITKVEPKAGIILNNSSIKPSKLTNTQTSSDSDLEHLLKLKSVAVSPLSRLAQVASKPDVQRFVTANNYKIEDLILIDEDDDIIGYNEEDDETEHSDNFNNTNNTTTTNNNNTANFYSDDNETSEPKKLKLDEENMQETPLVSNELNIAIDTSKTTSTSTNGASSSVLNACNDLLITDNISNNNDQKEDHRDDDQSKKTNKNDIDEVENEEKQTPKVVIEKVEEEKSILSSKITIKKHVRSRITRSTKETITKSKLEIEIENEEDDTNIVNKKNETLECQVDTIKNDYENQNVDSKAKNLIKKLKDENFRQTKALKKSTFASCSKQQKSLTNSNLNNENSSSSSSGSGGGGESVQNHTKSSNNSQNVNVKTNNESSSEQHNVRVTRRSSRLIQK